MAVAAPPATRYAAAPQSALAVDWRKVLRIGAIGGIVAVFLCTIGMVLQFNERMVIDPILSLGWATLLAIPLVGGYQATYVPVLEGIEGRKSGVHNLLGGLVAGLVGGSIMALFLVILDNYDLTDLFPNLRPQLFEMLTFGNGLGYGVAVMLLGGAGFALVGATFHLMSERLRRATVNGLLWVLYIGFLELVIAQVLGELGLDSLVDFVYSEERGVTVAAAVVIFVGAFALSWYLSPRRGRLRSRVAALPAAQKTRLSLVAAILIFALAVFAPTILGSFLNEILSNVGLFMIMALGLNIVVGYAGLLDLGYVAFFAVGAYTMAVLTSPESPQLSPQLTFWQAIPFVIVFAAIAGLIVGLPVIRMRGDYLAIVTLGFGEIARIILISDWAKPFFGGAQGIIRILPTGIVIPAWATTIGMALAGAVLAVVLVLIVRSFVDPRSVAERTEDGTLTWPRRWLTITAVVAVAFAAVGAAWGASIGEVVIRGTDPQAMVYVIMGFVVLVVFVAWRLEGSRIGRGWMAMREDEQVAEVMGIDTVTAKLLAFMTGAVIASFSGAVFAAKIGSVFPNSFNLLVSIIVLVIVIVGGMGSIPGVMVGALVLIGVLGGPTNPGLLREFEEFKLLIYGALLVFMMLKRPEGLIPNVRTSRELKADEVVQDAWLKAHAEEIEEES